MTKTPLEALEATIADFKANPEMRIRGDFAKDAAGRPTAVFSRNATCFCAIGRYAFHRGPEAVKATGDHDYSPFKIAEEIVPHSRDMWNPNDRDGSLEGKAIIPVLEGIRDRLKANLEAAA